MSDGSMTSVQIMSRRRPRRKCCFTPFLRFSASFFFMARSWSVVMMSVQTTLSAQQATTA